MTYAARWRNLRIAIPLLLLTTILMRLVWMQLRSYPVVHDARVILAKEHASQESACALDAAKVAKTGGDWRWRGDPESLISAWLTSPGLIWATRLACPLGLLGDRQVLRLNQWLLVATVLLATLMSRFLTSSWTVSLIVAGMLMSSGGLLADLGRVSADWLLTFSVTLWMTCLAHYLRSGSIATLAGAILALVMGSLFDRSLVVLSLAMPVVLLVGFVYRRQLARPMIQRMRLVNRRLMALAATSDGSPDVEIESFFGRIGASVRWMLGMEFTRREAMGYTPSFTRGTLFRTLVVPFPLWAYHRRRWLRLLAVWLLAFMILAGLAASMAFVFEDSAAPTSEALLKLWGLLRQPRLPGHFLDLWILTALERIDLHLAVSLLMLVICAWQSPASGLNGFLEATWVALAGFSLLALAALAFDALDAQLIEHLDLVGRRALWTLAFGTRGFMQWWEPVILTLGVAGAYNLMNVFDTRIAEKN